MGEDQSGGSFENLVRPSDVLLNQPQNLFGLHYLG